jgi:hypothetical protein
MRRTLMVGAVVIALVATACGDDSVTTLSSAPTTAASGPSTTATPAPGAPATTAAPSVIAAGECPIAAFQIDEVDSYRQAAGYPDPELAVTCGSSTFTVSSNDIPDFEFVQVTPNGLQPQDFSIEIPLTPTVRSTPGALGLGPIGVTANGLALFGAFEAPQDGYQDPYLDGLLDFCNGHTAPGGLYHFHARYDCIFNDPVQVGLTYGYLADGYQVVSPWVCVDAACTDTRKVTSSYVRTDPNGLGAFDAWEYVTGSGDLDECNGMTGSDGVYRYYLTDDFPYLPFCYHGETSYAQGDFTGQAPTGGPGGGAPPVP